MKWPDTRASSFGVSGHFVTPGSGAGKEECSVLFRASGRDIEGVYSKLDQESGAGGVGDVRVSYETTTPRQTSCEPRRDLSHSGRCGDAVTHPDTQGPVLMRKALREAHVRAVDITRSCVTPRYESSLKLALWL